MSKHMMERALWLIGNDANATSQFLADREGFAADFRLEGEERRLVTNLEVGELARRGVHVLLLLAAYRAVYGGESIPQYMASMTA